MGLTMNDKINDKERPASLDQFVAESDRPVLVDFWADWCGPCHALAPTIERLAKDYKGKAYVLKVDVDKRPRLAAKYQVQSIPTMILFEGGKPVWRQSGVLPYEAIADQLEQYVPA